MEKVNTPYQTYVDHMAEIADYRYSVAILAWDKEVYLPPKGAESRTRQIATLSTHAHRLFTSERTSAIINRALETDLTEIERINLIRSQEDYIKATKLSSAFVHTQSIAISESFHAWIDARAKNDYSVFAPKLDRLLSIKREEADLIGYEDHPYNALLDQYEPKMNVRFLEGFFQNAIPSIRSIIDRTNKDIDDSFLNRNYPEQAQWDFGLSILSDMGYDFEAGRQDKSTHPFSTTLGKGDSRVTTRLSEDNFAEMLWSTMHEGGHALYEQGLNQAAYGLPHGEALSLSIHESQSRLWENHIGRSQAFIDRYFPILQNTFAKSLQDVNADQFYRAINKIQPNFIRVEADELHYHIHVYIRYLVEKEIMGGQIKTTDLKDVWNSLYAEHMGVTVPDDKQGILQDIHWSHGSIGYFPTYSLGSFYAAQYYAHAEKAIPQLSTQHNNDIYAQLKSWLNNQIHQHGRILTADALTQQVTGEVLNPDYFIAYSNKKYLSA